MRDLTSPRLSFKQYLVVASLLFGLFFGAGNLIFPLHLGQLAGANWGPASSRFPSNRGPAAPAVCSRRCRYQG